MPAVPARKMAAQEAEMLLLQPVRKSSLLLPYFLGDDARAFLG
jgi:hypothetical protein